MERDTLPTAEPKERRKRQIPCPSPSRMPMFSAEQHATRDAGGERRATENVKVILLLMARTVAADTVPANGRLVRGTGQGLAGARRSHG